MVSREQILGHGVSADVLRRLVTTGTWHPISTGLFSLITNPGREALAWGGTLVGGPLSRLGPEASGHLHGLLRRAPMPIDVLVPNEHPVRGNSAGRSPGFVLVGHPDHRPD